MGRFAIVVLGAGVGVAFGGCVVGFEDYPVRDADGGAAAAGGGGSAGSGAGGALGGGSGSGGASGAAGVANGGGSGGGSGAGGVAGTGAGGTGGNAGSGATAGASGAGGAGGASGAGGTTVDCSQYVWGAAGGSCYAYAAVQASTPADCTSDAAQGPVIVACDQECVLPSNGACTPGQLVTKVSLGDFCVLNDPSPSCQPQCLNQGLYHQATTFSCDSAGLCTGNFVDCDNYVCNEPTKTCKTTCSSNGDCVLGKTCMGGDCV